MKKKGLLILAILILSTISASLISAQQAPGLDNALGNTSLEDFEKIADEKQREYLLENWKEIFLKNKAISSIDKFLTKINLVIFALFARDYSFSLEMFFTVIIWFAFLIALEGYADSFIENKGYAFLAALSSTILLAWLQLYNLIAKHTAKLVFSNTASKLFSFFSVLIIIVIICFFIFLNKAIVKKIILDKKEAKVKKLEREVKIQKRFMEES